MVYKRDGLTYASHGEEWILDDLMDQEYRKGKYKPVGKYKRHGSMHDSKHKRPHTKVWQNPKYRK